MLKKKAQGNLEMNCGEGKRGNGIQKLPGY